MGGQCCQPVVCLGVSERRVIKGSHTCREGGGNSGQSPSEPAGRKDHVLSLHLSFPISNQDPLGLKLIFRLYKLCAFTYSLQILLWGHCAVKSASRLKRISWKKVLHRSNLHQLIFNIETTRKTLRSSWPYLLGRSHEVIDLWSLNPSLSALMSLTQKICSNWQTDWPRDYKALLG